MLENSIPKQAQEAVNNEMRDPKFVAGLNEISPVSMSPKEASNSKSPSPTPNIGAGQAIGKA